MRMKVLFLLNSFLLAMCLCACNSDDDVDYKPLSMNNTCEVPLGDTVKIAVTGGSGNLVIEGTDCVDVMYAFQQDNQQQMISLVGKKIGEANIVVCDTTTNESCTVDIQVSNPYLTLRFEDEGRETLGLPPMHVFALVASEDSMCYVFQYSPAAFKYHDMPIMKGAYHISQSGTMLSFDLKGEKYNFQHAFRVNDYNAVHLLTEISDISALPKSLKVISLTDMDTGAEFPHVSLGNKVQKILPKRE